MIGNSNDAMAIRPMKSKSEDKFYLETYHSHDTSAEQCYLTYEVGSRPFKIVFLLVIAPISIITAMVGIVVLSTLILAVPEASHHGTVINVLLDIYLGI